MNKIRLQNGLAIPVLIGWLFLVAAGCDDDNGVTSEFATVSGTVIFDNVQLWPDSGVVQITIWPENVWTSFGPQGPPQNPNNPVTLVRNGNQTRYDYKIEGLPAGTYSAIAVGWRHPDESLPAERRSAVLGVYIGNTNEVSTGLEIPGSPFQDRLPMTVTLSKGENKTGLDIRADFAKLALFFPPGSN